MSILFSLALPAFNPLDGTLGWGAFDPNVPQPNEVQHLLPALGALDAIGVPQLVTYAQMTWSYKYLEVAKWKYLMSIYRATRNTATFSWGKVRLQWPDPQTGALVTASARFDPPQQQTRDVRIASNLSLSFSHVGRDDIVVNGTWLPPQGP